MSNTKLGFAVFDIGFRNICTPTSDEQTLKKGFWKLQDIKTGNSTEN